ncbi:glycosyltransferase [Paracoccus sp. S1E-3]|uniref:glycosyltransferase n=1 Tax=Paracoccus sp. S1E-3 TaxID=2756130 RepID=UPI0015EF8B22|nr:glycosyltransferase [Paracoccus sp. S1E-3]MBA4490851.1 glycosyltransferase [Paracoccus sp. S1E-3]
MRILMVQGGFGAGGAEKIMCALAHHRAAGGDEVHVAAMRMPKTGSFFSYSPEISLHVLDRAGRRPPAPVLQPMRALAIRRLIHKLQPDLIVSFLTKVNCLTLLAAAGTGVPVVISERNNPTVQSPHFWRRLQLALMPRAAGIAMQTKAAVADLHPAQAARAHVIPNHCNAVAFTRPAPAGHCRFVAAGRLDHQKGFDLLLTAFAQMPADCAATLDIFGEGQERQQLESQILALGLTGRARLAGLAPSAQSWLGAGDVLVVSSRYEGFCNVVAEATCSGLPLISFDCPYGPSEMIIHETNGLMVANGDVPAMTAAMTRIARDRALRDRLGSSAHITAARLSPAQILAQWDRLIAEADDHVLPSASTASS